MKKNIIFFLIINALLISVNAQNNCLDFDGVDNYVATTSAINLSGLGNDITFEAWIYVESFDDVAYGISSIMGTEDEDNGTALIRLGDPGESLDSNKLQFVLAYYVDGTLTQFKLNGTTGLSTNTWYHVAATFKKSTLDAYIYINGVQDANIYLGNETNFIANDILYIGAITGLQRYFDGKIDEIRVWSTARTQAELRANMYNELTGSETNLEAYYKLNENSGATADNTEETATYDGTLYNMEDADWLPSSAFFGPKNALNFDGGLQAGSPDYAYKTSNVTSETDNFTMMAWVFPDVVTNGEGGWRCIAYNGDDAGGYGIGIENSKVAGLFGTITYHVTDEVLSDGNWYHIAMRRNNGTVQFFLNGELLSYSNTKAPLAPSANFTIGNMYSNDGSSIYTDSFDGKIDEVRVYDAALTDEQIIENMCTSLEGDETNLVAYYNFDNSTGTTLQAFDGSTSNDLTLVNMANDDWVSSSAFNTWLNVETTNWSTATNWSLGTAPVLTDNVGIPDYSSDGGSYPIVNSLGTCNNLVVEDTISFDFDDSHTIHGSAFVIGHSDIKNDSKLEVTGSLYILPFSSLTMEPRGQLTIGKKFDNWAGTCTIKSDETNTGSMIVGESTSGDVTFERYIPSGKWHYISSPIVYDVGSTQFDDLAMDLGDPGSSSNQFYRWDESLSGKTIGYWVDILNGADGLGSNTLMDEEVFNLGQGYAIYYASAPKTLSLTNEIYVSNKEYILTKTTNSTFEGANLVGNPFCSDIAINTGADTDNNFNGVSDHLP